MKSTQIQLLFSVFLLCLLSASAHAYRTRPLVARHATEWKNPTGPSIYRPSYEETEYGSKPSFIKGNSGLYSRSYLRPYRRSMNRRAATIFDNRFRGSAGMMAFGSAAVKNGHDNGEEPMPE